MPSPEEHNLRRVILPGISLLSFLLSLTGLRPARRCFSSVNSVDPASYVHFYTIETERMLQEIFTSEFWARTSSSSTEVWLFLCLAFQFRTMQIYLHSHLWNTVSPPLLTRNGTSKAWCERFSSVLHERLAYRCQCFEGTWKTGAEKLVQAQEVFSIF